jgi:hypothetical protein
VKPDDALRSRAAISAITRLPRSIARVKIALGCPSAFTGLAVGGTANPA